jgi:hypothetical protein
MTEGLEILAGDASAHSRGFVRAAHHERLAALRSKKKMNDEASAARAESLRRQIAELPESLCR